MLPVAIALNQGAELAVAVATAALATFTWKLARATYRLDERVAGRERKRHERAVRGVARLVDGELRVVQASVKTALESNQWLWNLPTPHHAWDRDAALIVQTVPRGRGIGGDRGVLEVGRLGATCGDHT